MDRPEGTLSTSPEEPDFGPASPPMSPGNPWRDATPTKPSPPQSPVGSSSNCPSQESGGSRSLTPIAPQPLRPFIADPSLVPGRDKAVLPPLFPEHPVSASVHSFFDDGGSDAVPLAPQQITTQLHRQQSKYVPALMRQQGWAKSTKTLVYHWFIKNPKTSLLFWMADDAHAWPAANLHGLNDAMLPYSVADLEGIAHDPVYVSELQWKVAHKRLLRDRQHTEFVVKDTVPLETVRGFHADPSLDTTRSKRLDFVRFYDGSTPNTVYFRKKLDLRDYADKQAMLEQVREYHRARHPHVAEIVSSYARGQTIAFLTPRGDSGLDEYLDTFAGTSEAGLLLAWMRELASALAHLHSLRPPVVHGSLRPQKIVVYHEPPPEDGINGRSRTQASTVRLAVFNISRPARVARLFEPYSTDASYIYAAPEAVSGRREVGGQGGTAADVFSLGCIFLEMACAARGFPTSRLEGVRQADSHDASFHANLECIEEWFGLLTPPPPTQGPVSTGVARRERRAQAIGQALPIIRGMLARDPATRMDMQEVVGLFEQQMLQQEQETLQRQQREEQRQQMQLQQQRQQLLLQRQRQEDEEQQELEEQQRRQREREEQLLAGQRQREQEQPPQMQLPQRQRQQRQPPQAGGGPPLARPLRRRSGLNVGRELLRDRMAVGSNVWGELETLNGYYHQPAAGGSRRSSGEADESGGRRR
jgi:serine/threonine protein kinase